MSKILEERPQQLQFDNFNEIIDSDQYIKTSTTTAIIDIEMRIIDNLDSSIIRRASYGMLPNELSKYALSMMKINVSNVSKPKIYNLKIQVQH
jgi:hypothetical protein